MITWLFDKRNRYGFIPNLVTRTDIKPNTSEYWKLALTYPYSFDFRFLRYCGLEGVKAPCCLVSDDWTGPAYYPIRLNFWDPEIDYLGLMPPESLKLLQQGKFRVLFYYDEGDDPTVTQLPHLRKMLKHNNVSMNNIRVATANFNLKDKRPFVFIADDELHYRYLQLVTRKPEYVQDLNLDIREKKATCLTRADKVWRRIFGAQFVDLGLHSHCYYSYTNYQYENYNVDEDDIKNWQDVTPDLDRKLLTFGMQLPFKCDNLTDIEHNNHSIVVPEHHTNAYWNIVVETHFGQHTTFLTEKTFKPILNLQPFTIVGNSGSLKLLHYLGYKTFESVLDETYDKITNPQERMMELVKIINSIIHTSHEDHVKIQKNLRNILYHNHNHFLAPKAGRLNSFLEKLNY